jgi:hypothetical protein
MLWKKNGAFDEELRQLADADTLAFGGVGIAGTLLPATKAYFAVEEGLRQHGTELRPKLEALLDRAKPAGRLYAAELLTHVDAAAGRAAHVQRLHDGQHHPRPLCARSPQQLTPTAAATARHRYG